MRSAGILSTLMLTAASIAEIYPSSQTKKVHTKTPEESERKLKLAQEKRDKRNAKRIGGKK